MSAPVNTKTSYDEKYRITINRIVNGFRFSGDIPSHMYCLYADYICRRDMSLWTEDERKYIELMPELYSKYKTGGKARQHRKHTDEYVRDFSSSDYGRRYMLWLYNPETAELAHKFVRISDGAKFLQVGVPELANASGKKLIFAGYYVLQRKMSIEDYERLKELRNGNQ